MLTDLASGGAPAPIGHEEMFEPLLDPHRGKPDWQLLTPEALKKATDFAGLDPAVLMGDHAPTSDALPDKHAALASLFDEFQEAGPTGTEAEAEGQDGGDGAALHVAEQHEREIAALKADHFNELAGLQVRHDQEIVALLAERLTGIEANVAAEAERQVVAILQSVLSDTVARQSIAALSQELKDLLARGTIRRVLAHGPKSLYDQLAASMAESEIEIDHVESDAPDLTVEVDHKILVTRLSEWAVSVSECLP